MRIADLHQRFAELGALPAHRDSVIRSWLKGRALDAGTRRRPVDQTLPLTLRAGLPALTTELDNLVRLHSEHPGADGSSRLLLALADGQMVESVLLPRDGLCVSTQVGCAVGCRFCTTGKSGLLRQVSSLEIVAQVVAARRLRPVKKVVFMGMGEPAHNLDNVLEAIELLGTEGGIGHKNLVFSTVGDPRVFERLPTMHVKPALALSLHSTKAALREHLLPKAPAIAPAELLELAHHYAHETRYPLQVQWTLLKGINDGDDELSEIVRLFRGKYAVLNVIPFNSFSNDLGSGSDTPDAGAEPYQRPDGDRIVAIVRYLNHHGVLTRVRNSAGQDVDGGCGQLHARATGTDRSARRVSRIPVQSTT